MSLLTYKKKRHFDRTPEPAPGAGRIGNAKSKSLSYVIQKHAARRLHFDFRLELDGVLKSWAVPKGPPLAPRGKALAVEVEDHPIEYGRFEGTIPAGEYGGGTVLLWDKGAWSPIGDAHDGLREGKLTFMLDGERLKGEWTLVRMRRDSRGGKKNWLLINKNGQPVDQQILDGPSVKSDRTMEQIADARSSTWTSNRSSAKAGHNGAAKQTATKSARQKIKLPRIAPQLATWTPQPPHGDEWLHEVKFDGYRIMAYHDGANVLLLTRGEQDWTAKFPAVASRLEAALPAGTIVDGEMVVLDETGKSDFQAMQNTLKGTGRNRLMFFAFDLLFLRGEDVRARPLVERKASLAKVLTDVHGASPLRISEHVIGEGARVVQEACRMSLEGIISKRANSKYESRRGHSWLKSKCGHRQEFIVIGYTDPAGTRKGVGALLLGLHDENGKLRYAGRVGTGFDNDTLRDVATDLAAQQRASPPTHIAPPAREARQAHWVTPRRIVEVRFAGWTRDNLVRQASFLGFRQDKSPKEIVREDRPTQHVGARNGNHNGAARWSTPIRMTSPDRVVFDEEKITKLMLAQYYDTVAERMLPHVVDRPLTLLRCPDGLSSKCFFQRHLSQGMPDAIEEINVGTRGKPEKHLMIRDRAGLLSLVQMGAIEIHTWGSTDDKIEFPDRLVFDLDPDPKLGFADVKRAAVVVRDALQKLGLKPLLKTTGGKGLHVVVPINQAVEWPQAKEFSRVLADGLAKQHPKLFTANVRKTSRLGRLFLDYLRNARTATAVAPYSVRARPGAAVSMPLDWSALGRLRTADRFTVRDILRSGLPETDAWHDFESHRVDPHQLINTEAA